MPAFDGSELGPPVGYFTYSVTDDHWSWSPGIYALHGYTPDDVAPSTELLLKHKHPDDRSRAYEVLETAVRDGRPFSCYHRIIDRRGNVKSVLSVGRGHQDSCGGVESITGFFVDLTRVRRDETQAEVEKALLRIAEHRAVIEQAKGILMGATGCDADAAFAVLRRYSSTSNLKVHDLAYRLMEAVRREAADTGSRQRSGDAVLELLEDLAQPPAPSLHKRLDA